MTINNYYTVSDTVKYIKSKWGYSITKELIYYWISKGVLKTTLFGKKEKAIHVDDIDALIIERKKNKINKNDLRYKVK